MNVKLSMTNYKCFGSEPQGYDVIQPVNLIVGKNNSGKSTMLDLIDYATKPKDISSWRHKGEAPYIFFQHEIPVDILKRAFREDTSGGRIDGNHWRAFGKNLVGSSIEVQ